MTNLALDFFNGKTISITGASGYIGNAIIEQLEKVECTINRFSRRELRPVTDQVASFNDYVIDYQNIQKHKDVLLKSDIIIFLAAQTSLYTAEKNPKEDLIDNLAPLVDTLNICGEAKNTPHFVYASTVTVYGHQNTELTLNDSSPIDPSTIYDLNKVFGERYVDFYSQKNFVKGVSLRLANVYGPGTKESSSDRGIINLMAKKAVNGDPLTIYGHGEYTRDYVYIKDVACAFLKAAEKAQEISGKSFIIASGEGRTVKDAIKEVGEITQRLTDKSVSISHIDAPDGMLEIENRNFIGDTTAFQTQTGWKAQTSYAEGIEQTIRNFL